MGGLFRRKQLQPPELTGDPLLARILPTFLKGDYRPLQRLLALESAEDRYFYATEVAGVVPRQQVEQWVQQVPQSPESLLLRAAHGPNWAWQARSAAQASQVSDEQAREFFRRLEVASQDLSALSAVRPDDPNVPALQLILAKGQNRPLAERTELCQQLLQRDPNHFEGLRNYLDSILKKWGGSHEKALEFAQSALKKAPEGSPVGGLVLIALTEQWLFFDAFDHDHAGATAFRQDEEVIQMTLEAYRRSLGSPQYQNTPASVHLRNHGAFWLYLTGQKVPLKKELILIGKRLTTYPWAYLGNPGQTFAAARSFAGV